MEIIESKNKETILLLGNEAITRGALEAGILQKQRLNTALMFSLQVISFLQVQDTKMR